MSRSHVRQNVDEERISKEDMIGRWSLIVLPCRMTNDQ